MAKKSNQSAEKSPKGSVSSNSKAAEMPSSAEKQGKQKKSSNKTTSRTPKKSKAAGTSKAKTKTETSESAAATAAQSEFLTASDSIAAVKSSFSAMASENQRVTDKADEVSSQFYREQTLDFASLSSELTIEEVQEEAQFLEEENLSAESPLDRYVRRHREEVESAKISLGDSVDSTSSIPSSIKEKEEKQEEKSTEEADSQTTPILGVSGLDPVSVIGAAGAAADFVTNAPEKTHENEAQEGEIVDTSIFPAPTLSEIYESQLADAQKFDSVDVAASEPEFESESLPANRPKRSERFAAMNTAHPTTESSDSEDGYYSSVSDEEKEDKKSWKKPLVIGLAAVVVIGIAGYAGIQNYNSSKQATTKASSSQAASKIAAFNKDYEAFFTDSSHNVLKNSNFEKISGLGDDLNAISASDSQFTALQTKYNNLSNDISAIKSVNAVFDKPVITDGNFDDTVVFKNGANIPSVTSKNTTLNALLQRAVELAKSQQTSSSSSSSEAAQSASAASSSAGSSAAASAGTASSGTSTTESPAAITDNTTAPGTVYSQNPTGATPDNSGSRVPVQSIDPNSAAFQWPAGVLDQTIATMQNRGYISGNNYILTPVAVDTEGNGWYNIYRPDGSYLFSINCKTGFWAGAGGKHPDLPASFQ